MRLITLPVMLAVTGIACGRSLGSEPRSDPRDPAALFDEALELLALRPTRHPCLLPTYLYGVAYRAPSMTSR